MAYYLPAGKYIVGDPCYTVPDDEWGDLLTRTDFLQNEGSYQSPTNPDVVCRVAALGTFYGDGTYFDQFGNEYGVDAGMIGVVTYDGGEVPEGTRLVEFTEPFEVADLGEGLLQFGHITINTNDTQDEDHDDEDYSGDDDDDDFEFDTDRDEFDK